MPSREADRWKAVSITLAIALAASLIYVVMQETATDTGSSGYAVASGNESTDITFTDIMGLRSRVAEIVSKVRELERKGYDVYHAEYLLLSAIYHYVKGSKGKALQLFKKAIEELKNAKPLPELPELNFTVVDNTLYIKRIPTVWDFVPIGTVFALSERGYLVYPRNDMGWKLSCFIIIAVGRGGRGFFVYQGRLPLIPREAQPMGFRPRIYINGEWYYPEIRFAGPLYYDNGTRFKYPTVYEYDLSGRFMEYLTYIRENRTWIHGIVDLRTNKTLLLIKAKAVGTPMWLGEWNRTYIIHGVYAHKRDLDLWAGFWDYCIMEAKISVGGLNATFHGVFIFDRASHRAYNSRVALGGFGPPLEFSCMVIFQGGVNIMVTSTKNPSPMDPGIGFEHQLRINILGRGIVLDTTNFTLKYDKGLQTSRFKIIAFFNNGYLNITGKVIEYWPEKWLIGKGAWWDPSGAYSWGRAFTLWRGELVINGTKIEIKAIGVGEYTRYSHEASSCQVGCGGDCWCG